MLHLRDKWNIKTEHKILSEFKMLALINSNQKKATPALSIWDKYMLRYKI